MLTKVSVARVSCQVWDAGMDQTEETVPAESARLPGGGHSFAPILPFPCGISSSCARAARSCSGSWIWPLRWSGNRLG